MFRLENGIQRYAWGSHTALASLRGEGPTDHPEAELWMGAHPALPSRSDGRSLIDVIASQPDEMLGDVTAAEFGPRLPFLLKVLAAEQPLSLQAHPSNEQAEEGFDREERAGVPRNAPNRNYRDYSHKPELICALTPFVALCGFREPEATRALFESLAVPGLAELTARLSDLRAAFEWLMTLERGRREALVSDVVAACGRDGDFRDERAWAVKLGALYPGDAGVIGALLLNLVHLAPGEAIYLPAGNLHAYLHGVGIEIMASSDNVLRGGLTPKHVDVPELLRILDFRAGPVATIAPTRVGDRDVWRTPAREFELSRVRDHAKVAVAGPMIVLCTEGRLAAKGDWGAESLVAGDSIFVPGATRELSLSGNGTAYLATVP